MKKRYDPLWEIVGEKVRLQGEGATRTTRCPRCHVAVDLGAEAKTGECFRCGLCGTLCETVADQAGHGLSARVVGGES